MHITPEITDTLFLILYFLWKMVLALINGNKFKFSQILLATLIERRHDLKFFLKLPYVLFEKVRYSYLAVLAILALS